MPEQGHELWYDVESGAERRAPVGQSDLVPTYPEDATGWGRGFVLYTDYETEGDMWEADGFDRAHDDPPRRYGWLFPASATINVEVA